MEEVRLKRVIWKGDGMEEVRTNGVMLGEMG